MSKCNHEPICEQCVREKIKEHQERIDELNKKLPNGTTQNIIYQQYYNGLKYSAVESYCNSCWQKYVGYHSCISLVRN